MLEQHQQTSVTAKDQWEYMGLTHAHWPHAWAVRVELLQYLL